MAKKIDGYEFAGSEFKMLVSVIGAVGQSLEGSSREIDLHKWVSSSREYISTSLISDKKINLFDKKGLVFGFNNLGKGIFFERGACGSWSTQGHWQNGAV